MSKLKLYIGCSLALAPVAYREEVEAFKNTLRDDYEILDFVGVVADGFEKVYQWDIEHCVATCDLFVALCDLPSTGLGYELAAALRDFNKPVLAVAHEDAVVSGLVQGIPHKTYTFQRYKNLTAELPTIIKEKIAKDKLINPS